MENYQLVPVKMKEEENYQLIPVEMKEEMNYPTIPALPITPWETQIQLMRAEYLSQIRIEEARQKTSFAIQAEDAKTKIRADNAEKSLLKEIKIYLSSNGEIKFEQELFGENIKGTLPFTLRATYNLKAMGKLDEPEILYSVFSLENGRETSTLIDFSNRSKTKIKKQFHDAGINLGISKRKEETILELLICELKKIAIKIEVPVQHGWFIQENQWGYVFPNEITWKEIKARI